MRELIINPLTESGRIEIEATRKEYISLYTKKDEMLNQERDDLYVRYVRLIGTDKYENFKLSVEVRALRLKVALAQASLNRGEKPCVKDIEGKVNAKLEDYYIKVEQQASAIREAKNALSIEGHDLKEIRELYRMLVRRLHPDLNPNQSEQQKDLFLQGQSAYRNHNLAMLREIIMRLEIDADLEDLLARASESREEMLTRLQGQIEQLRQEIADLEKSFPFNHRTLLLDPVWINQQKEELKKEHKELREQKQAYAKRYRKLTENLV